VELKNLFENVLNLPCFRTKDEDGYENLVECRSGEKII
jgi:hypothetical protein